MCKKNNSMDVTKCTDCFTSYSGKSSTADHFTNDGRRIDPTIFQHFISPFWHTPPPQLQKRQVCKGCHEPTENKFFCDNCVEDYERKTGKRFNGICGRCRNCGVATLNADFCEDCVGYHKKPSEPASRGGKAATSEGANSGGKGVESQAIRDCVRCHMYTRNLRLPFCTNCGGNLVLRR
jgi:rRNA maturation protein Nop10